MIPFSIIAAVDSKLGIGRNGNLPWHLPSDMKYFKTITTYVPASEKINAVIMGRKTWESIPLKFRPLPERFNVVISRQTHLTLPDGVVHAESLEAALNFLAKTENAVGEIFVIGGAQIFSEAVRHPACEKIYLTHVDDEFFCDTFFPDVLQQFSEVSRKGPFVDNEIPLFFCEYTKNPQ